MKDKFISDFFIDDDQIPCTSEMLSSAILAAYDALSRRIKNGMRWKKKFLFFKARNGLMINRHKLVEVIAREHNGYYVIVLDVVINKYESSIHPVDSIVHKYETSILVKYDETKNQWRIGTE